MNAIETSTSKPYTVNAMSNNATFDASRFYDFVEHMDKKTLNRAERETLRKSVGVVKSATLRNLRGRWPGANSTKGGKRPSRGVVANVQKSTRGELYGQVHIMGKGGSGERGYLLRFFEMGTVERFAKVRSRAYRGRSAGELRASGMGYRGRIRPLWFFRDAVEATKTQVFDGIEDRMQAAVAKQWVKSAAKGGKS